MITLSNKGCRHAYMHGQCRCSAYRCWYDDQVTRQSSREPVETVAAWHTRVDAELADAQLDDR